MGTLGTNGLIYQSLRQMASYNLDIRTWQVSWTKSAMQPGVKRVAATRKWFRCTDLRMPKLQV